jgi:hypothetical protein
VCVRVSVLQVAALVTLLLAPVFVDRQLASFPKSAENRSLLPIK